MKLIYKHKGLSPMTKIIVWVFFIICLVLGLLAGTIGINNFFQTHYFKFSSPVKIGFFKPVELKIREPQIIKEIQILDYPDDIDTPIEQYICDKFGPYDCKVALAIAKAESGIREDAVNINTNNTIDVGIFQINSVHFKKPGCALKDIVDAKKNVDCAYTIWKSSGWNPWVAHNTGSYLTHLK